MAQYSPGVRSHGRPFLYIRREGSVKAFLHGLDIELNRGTADTVTAVGEVYLEYLKRFTPVGQPSGDPHHTAAALKAGWFMLVLNAGPKPRVMLLNKEQYLKWVLRGRGAIDQRAKPPGRRWPLHFWSGGEEIYAWHVGAVRPNPFDARAIRAARHKAQHVAGQELRQVVARAKARAKTAGS